VPGLDPQVQLASVLHLFAHPGKTGTTDDRLELLTGGYCLRVNVDLIWLSYRKEAENGCEQQLCAESEAAPACRVEPFAAQLCPT
jgi:hypothetical protein